MEYLKIKTDVLIIGGGGAGLRAAVAAADCGAQVILVSKRKVGIAGATAFPVAEMAGYNAGDIRIPGDTQSHYEDIMKAAQGMAVLNWQPLQQQMPREPFPNWKNGG